jgi:hypothetical protein
MLCHEFGWMYIQILDREGRYQRIKTINWDYASQVSSSGSTAAARVERGTELLVTGLCDEIARMVDELATEVESGIELVVEGCDETAADDFAM